MFYMLHTQVQNSNNIPFNNNLELRNLRLTDDFIKIFKMFKEVIGVQSTTIC